MNLALLPAALAERVVTFVPTVLDLTDLLLVDTVQPRFGPHDPDVLLALALAVRGPRKGHVGVDLLTVAKTVDDDRVVPYSDEPVVALDWPPDAQAWQAKVLTAAMVGPPEGRTPFVKQALRNGHTLVMTRRMWNEQAVLAERLRALAVPVGDPLPEQAVEAGLAALGVTGEAAKAVRTALARRLTVVTGGPGTGKTFSIKRLLALLLENDAGTRPIHIVLAAPTGKAAVRMAEAIQEQLSELHGISDRTRERLTQLAPRTLHKLLGVHPDGGTRFHQGNPLEADVIVVDEASMVDLTLMRQLLDAVPAHARLILLGDRDQLASVEAGTVLADLVWGETQQSVTDDNPLRQSVVRFTESRRFAKAPSIGQIAKLLQNAEKSNEREALALLNGTGELPPLETLPDRVTCLGAPENGRPTVAQLERLAAPYVLGYAALLKAAMDAHGPRDEALKSADFHAGLLAAFEAYRVLAVHRNGPLGVKGLERALAERVRKSLGEHVQTKSGFWAGQPVLVTENAYDVGLMNGDVGLILPTADGLQAIFPRTVAGVLHTKPVPLARLPQVTGALAMTVHKSQGSQFARVALVLADRDSPIQTRELVYTGITRASERLDWLGTSARMETALSRRVTRASGLAELLW